MAGKKKTVTFGLIVGTRGIFNSELAAADRKKLLNVLDELGYSYVIPPPEQTTKGGRETRKDALLCAELFRTRASEIDGIIISLPNFGDDLAVVQTLEASKLDVPILVQASPDEISKVDIRSRREAFQTVRFSEKILQANGITVVPVDLSWIFANTGKIGQEDPALLQKVNQLHSYGTIPERIPAEHVMRSARLSLAIESWLEENDCDASAVQCWNSVQLNYGCATCVTMSMLSNSLKPSACEVDITGALSMLVLSLAGETPAALLDWNNNFGDDPDMCVNTHCSNFPKDFVADEIEISELDLLWEDLGRDKSFGAVKGRVKAGPATFIRVSTDDTMGDIKGYVGEGMFTDDAFGMDGGIAVVRVAGLRGLLRHITQNGFEHHVAMTRGHVRSPIEETFSSYLGWDIYFHGKEAE
jgi:L-fucose isomerase-like protein